MTDPEKSDNLKVNNFVYEKHISLLADILSHKQTFLFEEKSLFTDNICDFFACVLGCDAGCAR
jgi:hypothetical protein